MTALLAMQLASSLLLAMGAVRGTREHCCPLPQGGSPSALRCRMRPSCAGGRWKEGPWLLECHLEDSLAHHLAHIFTFCSVRSTLSS